MNLGRLGLSEALYDYILSVSLREADVLRRLREETARMPLAIMQIAPEQGQFMALIVELMGAKRTREAGVFTGYSSLAVALALPDESFGVAVSVAVWEPLSDGAGAVRGLHRVLRTGGAFAVVINVFTGITGGHSILDESLEGS